MKNYPLCIHLYILWPSEPENIALKNENDHYVFVVVNIKTSEGIPRKFLCDNVFKNANTIL